MGHARLSLIHIWWLICCRESHRDVDAQRVVINCTALRAVAQAVRKLRVLPRRGIEQHHIVDALLRALLVALTRGGTVRRALHGKDAVGVVVTSKCLSGGIVAAPIEVSVARAIAFGGAVASPPPVIPRARIGHTNLIPLIFVLHAMDAMRMPVRVARPGARMQAWLEALWISVPEAIRKLDRLKQAFAQLSGVDNALQPLANDCIEVGDVDMWDHCVVSKRRVPNWLKEVRAAHFVADWHAVTTTIRKVLRERLDVVFGWAAAAITVECPIKDVGVRRVGLSTMLRFAQRRVVQAGALRDKVVFATDGVILWRHARLEHEAHEAGVVSLVVEAAGAVHDCHVINIVVSPPRCSPYALRRSGERMRRIVALIVQVLGLPHQPAIRVAAPRDVVVKSGVALLDDHAQLGVVVDLLLALHATVDRGVRDAFLVDVLALLAHRDGRC